MLQAWMLNTLKSYHLYKRKRRTYCLICGVNPLQPSERSVLDFLAELADKRASYSSTNSLHSTLSNFLPRVGNRRVGQTDNVCILMKGIRNTHPPLSRWNATWDVDLLLDFLREWSPLRNLTLKQLTFKLVTLVLVTGFRQ